MSFGSNVTPRKFGRKDKPKPWRCHVCGRIEHSWRDVCANCNTERKVKRDR